MNESITLEDMLAAREARAQRQTEIMAKFTGVSLISLTVNMPGPVKRTVNAVRVFWAGYEAVKDMLRKQAEPVIYESLIELPTGNELILAVNMPADELKRLCCVLEEKLPWGRLLDIDVVYDKGHLSRTDIGIPERGCMVCGRPGRDCASRRLHTLSQIIGAFDAMCITMGEDRH